MHYVVIHKSDVARAYSAASKAALAAGLECTVIKSGPLVLHVRARTPFRSDAFTRWRGIVERSGFKVEVRLR